MYQKRTDLALEAREIASESSRKIPGVTAEEYERDGFYINKVKILDKEGERAIGKPIGTYITIDLKKLLKREDDAFIQVTKLLASELSSILPKQRDKTILVAGLGNRNITPDAVGPKCIDYIMVTRHLIEKMPNEFAAFSSAAAIAPGVLGLTGVETGEIIKGVCEKVNPYAVIVVDALAARRVSRLCTTIQIADSGIVPGSGVGNARNAITKDTLGVPVIAIGVPTVVDAGTLALDIMEEAGVKKIDLQKLNLLKEPMVVTPKEIDKYIGDAAKVVGYGINFAVHDDLSLEDVDMFLS